MRQQRTSPGFQLAFPDYYRVPTEFRQSDQIGRVARHVPIQLTVPKFHVGGRPSAFPTVMTVPKATLNKNRRT